MEQMSESCCEAAVPGFLPGRQAGVAIYLEGDGDSQSKLLAFTANSRFPINVGADKDLGGVKALRNTSLEIPSCAGLVVSMSGFRLDHKLLEYVSYSSLYLPSLHQGLYPPTGAEEMHE